MKILKVNKNSSYLDVINEGIDVLTDGGVVLYPTDTVYGLGANIFNKAAVRKVYDIKKRSYSKPLSILVSDIKAIKHVAEINAEYMDIIEKYLPGPYTLILRKKSIVPYYVTANLIHVGIRIPENKIARGLSEIFPITTTSANLSNQEILDTPSKIIKQLDADIDLVIDVGRLDSNKPSTLIDLTKNKVKILSRK